MMDTHSLRLPAGANRNSCDAELIELAVARGEGKFSASGALSVETGVHTGRSVQDKFIVRDASTDRTIWWDNNKPLAPEQFALLWDDFRRHAEGRQLFVQDLHAGASPAHRLNARIFTEYAWHAQFIRCLLRKPQAAELADFQPGFTVISLPSFRADPRRHGVRTETVIACNFAARLVLIGGTSYAGEIKKSVFTYLNYVMPESGVMPMHCSANVDDKGAVDHLLRAVGHGQDHAVRGSQAYLAGRRRARLGRYRHLQLRRWLLRENHPPVQGGGTRDLGGHQPLRYRA